MKNAIMHSEKHNINNKMSSYNKGSYLLLKICKKQKKSDANKPASEVHMHNFLCAQW